MATLIPVTGTFAEFLTRVLPRTFRFSPRIPVSVYGTGGSSLTRSFLDSVSQQLRSHLCSPASRLRLQCTDLPMHHPTRLHMLFHSHACLPFCVTPLLKQLLPVLEYQPVVHLLRSLPRIRSRLTPGDARSLLRILMLSVERILTFLFATIPTFSHKSTEPSSSTSSLHGNVSLPCIFTRIQPQLRFRTLAPGIFRRRVSDQ